MIIMDQKIIMNLIIVFSLMLLTKSKDNSTLSNYQSISLTNLNGIFEPDFDQKIIIGNLEYTFLSKENGDIITLDAKYLDIISIKNNDTGNDLKYTFGEKNEKLGTPLNIKYDYKKGDIIHVNISYKTTPEGSSVQFLTKNQTVDKTHPYLFTMSEMIYGRELLPSQDTPAIKFTFYLGIKVKEDIRGMISGIFDHYDNDTNIYYYRQDIPVPNYLIALAAGKIVERKINDMITIYSESGFIDLAYDELKDQMHKIFN